MIWYLVGAALVVFYVAFFAWFAFEAVTAPVVDEAGGVVSDDHHRLRGRWWPNLYRGRLSRARDVTVAASPPTDTEQLGS